MSRPTELARSGSMGSSSASGSAPTVVVVGAGITGLVTARELAAQGVRVIVLERAPTVGGQLAEATVGGHRIDVGAESVFTAAPGPLALIEELGLAERVVPANEATTWISTERGLRPLPAGFTPAGPTRLAPVMRSRVLSLRGMLRAGMEPLVPRARTEGDQDLAVGHYLERRFGSEVTDRLVDPLLGGLHAGDVRTLSLHAATPQLATLAARHRSLLLRRRPAPRSGPAFVTLTSGMRSLAEALATSLTRVEIQLNTGVEHVERRGGGLAVITKDGATHRVDGVVLATSARAAAALLTDGSPDAAGAVGALRAASVTVAGLAYPRAAATVPAIANGTGILVPSDRGLLLKAATFLSTKWPHHADDEVVLIRASAGRAGDDRAISLDDHELVARLHADLCAETGLSVEPIDATVQRWPATMPQLEVGHLDRLEAITTALDRDLPGVHVAGAPYHGPGLASCLRSATSAAAHLVAVLEERPR
ncbi:MAG: protoporphyrinogen oxidase [Nitriliruptoraceae bacterium]